MRHPQGCFISVAKQSNFTLFTKHPRRKAFVARSARLYKIKRIFAIWGQKKGKTSDFPSNTTELCECGTYVCVCVLRNNKEFSHQHTQTHTTASSSSLNCEQTLRGARIFLRRANRFQYVREISHTLECFSLSLSFFQAHSLSCTRAQFSPRPFGTCGGTLQLYALRCLRTDAV